MSKKVAFGTTPNLKALDDLVQSRAVPPLSAPVAAPAVVGVPPPTMSAPVPAPEAPQERKEPTRRVSVDLPIPLHTKLKLHCVQNGVLIADYVRDLIVGELNKQ